jgi:replicative DNA helicase
MTPKYTTGADLFGSWFADVEHGEPPTRFVLPPPFGSLDIRPARLILFGGAPGSGKTAALLQVGIDLLRQNATARLLVANVEMHPALLVDRIVSRLSGVPLSRISDRALSPDELKRVRVAVDSLASVTDRFAFLNPPYSLEHMASAATEFKASVLILDYIQRFTVGDSSKADKREQLETAATVLRRFCDAGAAILVASAVARQRSNSGSTYRGLNLASFRGSSELEYGADAAYLFAPGEGGIVTLQCEKNRYGPCADIVATFDATIQKFAPAPCGLEAFDAATPAATRTSSPKGG